MVARRCLWKFLAGLFFLLGIIPAGPLWLVSQLGRACFALANLFMGPCTICWGISKGDLDINGNPKRPPRESKWHIVRGDGRTIDAMARGKRGRR